MILSGYHDVDIMISMRTRTILSLDARQLRALQDRARAERISVAALMRRLVAEYLRPDRPVTPVPLSRYERLVGLGSSGRKDIADRHDALLADALRHEHDG